MTVTSTTRHRVTSRPRARAASAEAARPVTLRVEGLTSSTPDGVRLLDDVSFSLRKGWLVAVVGPTGAGKTSLANALTGALRIESGSVWLEGVDLATADDAARRRIAYVPQDSVLHSQLDLRRTLEYAAVLRLPPTTGPQERAHRVSGVLAELGLEGSAHLPVGALSGGQRKRANIAAELVGDPQLIVLDEPTSGLDPGYEKSVLASLRQLADSGRTVLTVTHSLTVLEQCDRVLFLAPGGRVAFFGPPAEAAAFFDRRDPADVFAALDSEPGTSWQRRFRDDPAYARYVGAPVADGPTNEPHTATPSARWLRQLTTLVRRHVALIRSDRRHLALLLLEGPMLGLLLYAVIAPNALGPWGAAPTSASTASVAMFLAVSATWLGATNAIREIVKERMILRREVGSGLAPSAYVSAKMLSLSVVTSAQVSVLTVVATLRQGPLPRGSVLSSGLAELIVAGVLVGLAAVGMALLISALVTTMDKALTLLPIAMVTQMALTGGPASLFTVPGIRQIRALTGAHWAVEAITATVAGDRDTWWSAVVALLALTVTSVLLTVALVRRSTRSASHVAWRPELTLSGPVSRPLLGVAAAVVLFGCASVAIPRLQSDGAHPSTAAAAEKTFPVVGQPEPDVRRPDPAAVVPQPASSPVLPAPRTPVGAGRGVTIALTPVVRVDAPVTVPVTQPIAPPAVQPTASAPSPKPNGPEYGEGEGSWWTWNAIGKKP